MYLASFLPLSQLLDKQTIPNTKLFRAKQKIISREIDFYFARNRFLFHANGKRHTSTHTYSMPLTGANIPINGYFMLYNIKFGNISTD